MLPNKCGECHKTMYDWKLADRPSSVVLYDAISEYVTRNAREMTFSKARKLVAEFYDSWGFLPPTEMVGKVSEELDEGVNRYIKIISRHGEYPSIAKFAEIYEAFTKAFKYMNQLIANPNGFYFDQRAYV